MQAVRYYGAWGEVRVGNTTGDSIWRYCASLGHVQDDESGLVYMRARYYEPSSGRFVSEDPSREGMNWYASCSNAPTTYVDFTGKKSLIDWILALGVTAFLVGGFKELMNEMGDGKGPINAGRVLAKATQAGLLGAVSTILGDSWINAVNVGITVGKARGELGYAVTMIALYTVLIAVAIALIDYESDQLIDTYLPR